VRDHGDTVDTLALDASSRILARIAGDLERCTEVASLRGLEGHSAGAYFGVFDHLIVARKDAFFMHERSRRPPLDAMNSLLSFLYTLLAHDVASALETVGLDPAVGFLHKERPGRPSLALDLMEEFRSVVAERTALSLVNRQQVKGAGFRTTETGAVLMTDETRKKVLQEYQKRKQEGIRHPFLNEKMPVGLLPHAQALLLARYLRGDLDGYPAFLWR
jgi:CRISPR-associated protein Cas1